ncbi:hypothetical protein F2Q70_00027953 [Brassica cretica]|uniref:Uncharacterized protein n=1 Tax=Brassica cretica TaxID=69181 RepID=A0A8S9LBB2_BRACR|nr:hypothetical protein F2Q70_00027953 [Brassica cretica]
MPRFEPLDYAILKPSGENYLEWAMNTSVVLKSRGLGLISCLTVIENDKLLKKSSEMRYPEAMDQDESKAAVSNVTDGVADLSIN